MHTPARPRTHARTRTCTTLANFELIPMQIRSMPNLGLVGARVERLDWALGSTNL